MSPEKLLLQLVILYAKDTTEHADIQVANELCRLLKAKTAAIFFKDLSGMYHLRFSGSLYSIKLSSTHWKEVEAALSVAHCEDPCSFGPWKIPVFGEEETYWIGCSLFSAPSALQGYIVLGRSDTPWDERTLALLQEIAKTIATIIAIRVKLNVSEYEKKKLIDRLAFNERRLKNLFDASPNIIYTCDADDYITSLNPAGLKALGITSQEEVVGRPFKELLYNPEDRNIAFKHLLSTGTSTYETILKGKNERLIYCMESIAVLRDENGKIRELQGIINDITERIEKEKELWRTNLELSELNSKLQKTQELMVQQEKLASIGQLAAGVAHEINNPLGFLKSNHSVMEKYVSKAETLLQKIADSGIPEASKPIMEQLVKQIDKMKEILIESTEGYERIIRIVADLKTFSRLDKGEGFAEYDLNAGIESTLVVAWNEIKYVADVEKQLGNIPKIMARGNELNQVWLNLLVNAAQAIEGAKKEVRGRIIIKTWEEKGYVMVSIKDNGPGIPESIRKKIFDPFFTTKEPGKGTGLGLSISYNIIVENHKGQIIVNTEPGQGTEFVVILPLSPPKKVDN
ncbi:ATP-binding protein [Gracilinema caldarium]|uniref:ATP-binding protein n=1 Tax=Gracilinema caldarium TaxID=215591 RepID=UPI0026F21446|nr:ATP-binding protein [Gracilinema caldarium]